MTHAGRLRPGGPIRGCGRTPDNRAASCRGARPRDPDRVIKLMYRSVVSAVCLWLLLSCPASGDAPQAMPASAASLPGETIQSPPGEPATPVARAPAFAVGDVGPNQALFWVQGEGPGRVVVEVESDGPSAPQRLQRELDASRDYTAKLTLNGLSPGRRQRWRAVLIGADEQPGAITQGSFRTAPPSSAPLAVRLVFGADLAGQNVCRDAAAGFEVFGAMAAREPELFVALGDMTYADGLCEATGRYGNAQVPGDFGPASDLAGFRAHWRYARADAGLRRLLASTVYLPTWDDHEVVNDVGPLHDTRADPPYTPGEPLLPIGLAAMLEQNPIGEHPDRPGRLYRAVRWGKHLEVLLLDTRQYRDANSAVDAPERPKTMLGREQLTWLKERLRQSDATWIIIASSVPLAIPTGAPAEGGRDGWAGFDQPTGFAQERDEILRVAADLGRNNLVFITADVHFAAAFSHRPRATLPSFVVHELVAGPLSAGIGVIDDYDRGLGSARLFMHAPPTRDALRTYADARRFFGFGELDIADSGSLTATLRGVDGGVLHELRLTPETATRLATLR
jgi:alkaline phosphatase D